MKALCITGSDEKLLAEIAAPFYHVGMQPPKGLRREREIDFSYWHNSVSESLANKRPFGKMWEDIACDLILANHGSDFWGWHEAKSVDALEFWAALDPDIYFLLVCTKPERELAQRITETDSEAEAQNWLENWHHRHQRMLEFYLKNPERCMLVDAEDASRHLAKQLSVVKEQWRLPLGTSSKSIDKKIAKICESDHEKLLEGEESSHIANLIVQGLTKSSRKDIVSLRMELQAAQYPFSDDSIAGANGKVLTSDIETTQLQGLLSDYKRLRSLANERLLLKLEQEKTLDANASLERDKRKEAQARSLAEEKAIKAQKALEETSNSLKEAEQENELLLLQLHQVQEELEHYFLQYQEQVQENKQLSARVERLKQSAGGNFASSVQVEKVKKGFGAELQWLLGGVTLDGEEFQQLAFTTFVKSGQLGVRIDPQKVGAFINCWPGAIESSDSLVIHSNNLSLLSSLSDSDYKRLMQLPQLLKNSLGQTNLNEREKYRWLKALDKYSQVLLKLPPRLSYESVKLVHEQVNPDYEHLWLKLKAPSFGKRSASEWNFRISCASIGSGDFGRYPKLELPEQPEQLMHKWYPESQDENGKKLELRFALPRSVDFGVWQQIAAEDQLLLSALLRQLPSIINELRTQNRRISRSWDDWQQLVADMWRILNEKLKR